MTHTLKFRAFIFIIRKSDLEEIITEYFFFLDYEYFVLVLHMKKYQV